jgi:thioredoxin 1
MAENILHLTDKDFEEVLKSSAIPVVVDFWAEWCGPCKSFGPIFEEVADEFVGKVQFAKANVDEDNSNSSAKYNIRGIPTLIFFEKGKEKATKVGSLSKKQLIDFIEENLK